MTSTMSPEPQSIVHHMLRAERRVAHALKKLRRRGRPKAKRANSDTFCLSGFDMLSSTFDDHHSETTEGMSESFHQQPSLLTDAEYETIDQSEFLESDCIMTGTNEDLIFIHFFLPESLVSENIDLQINELTTALPECTYFRINTKLAPFITSKLKISNTKPVVVAMKSGVVVNKISDFGASFDCGKLQVWAATVELLKKSQ